jgi:hypothetical protein
VSSGAAGDESEPENTQPYIGYYFVCLMDILGQKQRLKDWSRLPSDGQITDDLIQALKKTVGTVLSYRQLYEDYFAPFGGDPDASVALDRLRPEQREKFLRIRECSLSTQQFSDTFVFYTPVTNRHGDMSGACFFQMLTSAAMAVLCGLAGKAPIRGAVTVGAGMEISPGNFYGPALAEAHQLESEVAGYPRVVLSQSAVDFARSTRGFSGDPEIEAVSAAYHEQHIRPLLCTDTDGQVIVDFMGQEVYSKVSEEPEIVDAAASAYRFVKSELARFQSASDTMLADRYGRLLEYMQARLTIWGISGD